MISDVKYGWGGDAGFPKIYRAETPEAQDLILEALTAAAGNRDQIRVPKGNGELSGRWVDMPGAIGEDLLKEEPGLNIDAEFLKSVTPESMMDLVVRRRLRGFLAYLRQQPRSEAIDTAAGKIRDLLNLDLTLYEFEKEAIGGPKDGVESGDVGGNPKVIDPKNVGVPKYQVVGEAGPELVTTPRGSQVAAECPSTARLGLTVVLTPDGPRAVRLAAGGKDHWKKQLRIPKGNGQSSGRWAYTPWLIMDRVLEKAKGFDDLPKIWQDLKAAEDYIKIFDREKFDGNMSDPLQADVLSQVADTLAQRLTSADEAALELGIDLGIGREIAAMNDFAQTDWTLFDEDTDLGKPAAEDIGASDNAFPEGIPADWTVSSDGSTFYAPSKKVGVRKEYDGWYVVDDLGFKVDGVAYPSAEQASNAALDDGDTGNAFPEGIPADWPEGIPADWVAGENNTFYDPSGEVGVEGVKGGLIKLWYVVKVTDEKGNYSYQSSHSTAGEAVAAALSEVEDPAESAGFDDVEILSPPPPPSDVTPEVVNWTKLSGPQGSNPGGVYKDESGTEHYVKFSKSDVHAKNEILAGKLYALAGVKTTNPSAVIWDGVRLGTSAELIDGKQDLKSKLNSPAYLKKVGEGFAADVWLANWDTVGMGYDNIMTDKNGDPVRVDLGGSLLFRAQGTAKGDDFNGDPTEWDSLRDPAINPQSAKVFGGLSDEDLANGATKIGAITDDEIDALVDSVFEGPGDSAAANHLKKTLKARRDAIAKKGQVAQKTSVPTPTKVVAQDGTVKVTATVPSMGIQVGDVIDGKVVGSIKVGTKWVDLFDENGKRIGKTGVLKNGGTATVTRELKPVAIEVAGTDIKPGDIINGKTVASVKVGTKWVDPLDENGKRIGKTGVLKDGGTIVVMRTPAIDGVAAKTEGTLAGTPAPIAPVEPIKPEPGVPAPGSFESWLDKVKARYDANPNKVKPDLQSSAKWPKVEQAISSNWTQAEAAIQSLHSSKYLDDDLKSEIIQIYSDAMNPSPEVKAAYENALKSYTAAKAEYDTALAAWRKDNPTSLLGMEGAKRFTSNTQAVEWANKNLPRFQKGASWDAMKEFTGSYSGITNGLLNDAKGDLSKITDAQILKRIKDLDAGMKPIDQDIYLFRGTYGGELTGGNSLPSLTELQKLVGKTFTQPSFMSSSVGKENPGYMGGAPVQIVFRAPKGTVGGWAGTDSSNPTEREFIIARGTRYIVHKVTKNPNTGNTFVEAEIITDPNYDPTGETASTLKTPIGGFGHGKFALLLANAKVQSKFATKKWPNRGSTDHVDHHP